jgi:cyclopropane fatty-acyl-phospholipid synthase-like methyltransferase
VSEEQAARFFNSFADRFDSLYDGKRNPLMRLIDHQFRSDIEIRYRLTFERLGDLSGKTVADIGCGSGPYVVEALRRGARHVVAVDPAANMLDLVNRRLDETGLAGRCTTVHGLFPDVRVPPSDHAIVMGVMDYIADPTPFLTALREVTQVSAMISFSSEHWFRTPIRKARYKWRQCPVYFYSADQIHSICKNAGFRETRVVKIPGAGQDYHVCVNR